MLNRTFAVADKILSDLRKTTFVINVVVQCIFLANYAYSIYKNVHNYLFLAIYVILYAISTTTFVLDLVHKKTKGDYSKLKRAMRIVKYVANATMVGVNTFNVFVGTPSDLTKLLLIVSAVSLLIQIAVECVRVAVERYGALLMQAFQADVAFIENLSKIRETKGNFYRLVDAPLGAIANKLNKTKEEEPVLSKDEAYIESLASEYKKTRKAIKDEKKKTTKEQIKQRSNETAQKQKEEIKRHLKEIKEHFFKPKTQRSKPTELPPPPTDTQDDSLPLSDANQKE